MSKHRVPREAMVSPSLEILKEDTALVAQLEQWGWTRPSQGPSHPLMPTSTTSWFRGLQPASEHSCQKWPQGRWFLFNIITIPRVLMPNHLSHPLQPGRARPCTNSERKILHLSSFYSLIQTKLHFNKCRTNALLKEIASLIKVFKLNVTDGIY